MKLSGAVRNHWANELPAAAGAANRPVVRTALVPYPIVNNLMRICIAVIIFMLKNLHFVQSISCHKRHDLIIYKVYCCFACQMTKQHN